MKLKISTPILILKGALFKYMLPLVYYSLLILDCQKPPVIDGWHVVCSDTSSGF